MYSQRYLRSPAVKGLGYDSESSKRRYLLTFLEIFCLALLSQAAKQIASCPLHV